MNTMVHPKRVVAFAVVSLVGLAAALPVRAESYPDHPITIAVPFTAGGTTDLITRALTDAMGAAMHASFVVVNWTGAAGAVGTARVAKARPDGYTVGMLPVGPLTSQPYIQHLSYSPESFKYVCLVYSDPQALVVRKNSPFETVKQVVDYAREHPGKLTFATTGAGTIPHLGMVEFAADAGINLVHVPYQGEANILTNLLGGFVDSMVAHPAFVESNPDSLRAIAVMAPKRMPEYPNLPTFAEAGYPVNATVWGGLAVPKDTPEPVVEKLESACRTATSSGSYVARLKNQRMPQAYMGSKEFTAFVLSQYQQTGKLLKSAGMLK
ncbi:MAG: tripartite tricarboxylate transporter substrate binding protein [Proteobacteria bacterium]|nr:tripartite tricarboxylate transporter substrate binding protein [Pseudomonadota bacterium]